MTVHSATTAALLTPLAPGAISVIGLAGPKTDGILAQLFRKPTGDAPPIFQDRRPTFCQMVDGDTVVDDVVVVRIPRGETITAELNTHGGVRVVQRALLLLERHGASIVDGRDYYEAMIPASAVERAADMTLLGAKSRRLTEWLLAQRSILPPFLAGSASLSEQERAAFLARSEAAIRLIAGIQIALVGPPNAGKSTLANRLIGSDRAITSEQAGTTRDWISETALIGGWPVTLTDTAGIRQTECEIEAEAIRRSRTQAHGADAILVVLDATVADDVRCRDLGAILPVLPDDRPVVVALNKCDHADAPSELSGVQSCRISALTGQGVGELERRISGMLGLNLLEALQPTAFLPIQLDEVRAS